MRERFGNRKIFLMSAVAIVTFAVPFAFSLTYAKSVQAQPQPQAAVFNVADFKFEVAWIKPAKDPDGGWGLNNTDDGIRGLNIPLLYLVKEAYGIYEDNRYSGAPNWINSAHYDFEAKMDSSIAEQFRKLPRAQSILAERHMLQVLLADRFNLQVHHDTKEFPVYFLVVAKNGTKLQESKPKPDDPSAENGVWGGDGVKAGMITTKAHIVPIEQLAGVLTQIVGRTVLDKTGLMGRYDFTLQYADERRRAPGASEGQPPSAPEPSGPSIFTALQDQLGLKLESGKGPIEIIVIDHIEKASGN